MAVDAAVADAASFVAITTAAPAVEWPSFSRDELSLTLPVLRRAGNDYNIVGALVRVRRPLFVPDPEDGKRAPYYCAAFVLALRPLGSSVRSCLVGLHLLGVAEWTGIAWVRLETVSNTALGLQRAAATFCEHAPRGERLQRLSALKRRLAEDEEYRLLLRRRPWCAACLLYTSPSPRDGLLSRMPSSA